jgi:hypothetical protein
MVCSVITTTLTYTRRLVRGNHVYLYRVTSYRDRETGKVKQKTEYVGKEVVKDNVSTVQKPRNRITARRVLDSAPYIMYRFAEEFGLQDSFLATLEGLTGMREAGGFIEIHTGIRDGTAKEYRDLMDFVGSPDPDVISMMERSISGRIVKSFWSGEIVYDLSAIRYYGSGKELAKYGHYYHSNGGNKETNFVLAVTGDHGIPVHHRIMPREHSVCEYGQ